MQRLSYDIIKQLLECKEPVTSTEINLLVYISQFQSERGSVNGVYYKSVSDALNISFQAFYDALYGLERKGVIMLRKGSYYDWDILILNNNFTDYNYNSPDAESYLSTGRDIFHDKRFYQLKAKEKLLAMYFIVCSGAGKRSYRHSTQEFVDKFCKLFQVTKRALQGYLTSLRKFFSIGVKGQMYWITPRKEFMQNEKATDRSMFAQAVAKTSIRRSKAVVTQSEYKEIEKLAGQYFNEPEYKNKSRLLRRCFLRAVEKCIELRNQGVANKYKWKREVNLAFIHKLYDQELVKSYGDMN